MIAAACGTGTVSAISGVASAPKPLAKPLLDSPSPAPPERRRRRTTGRRRGRAPGSRGGPARAGMGGRGAWSAIGSLRARVTIVRCSLLPAGCAAFFCDVAAKRRDGMPPTLPKTWPRSGSPSTRVRGRPRRHRRRAGCRLCRRRRPHQSVPAPVDASVDQRAGLDRPASGIRQAFELLARRRGSAHEAQHAMMDCLGEMLGRRKGTGLPPDGDAYLDCVRRRATGP